MSTILSNRWGKKESIKEYKNSKLLDKEIKIPKNSIFLIF